jgi:hypothetical protein
MSGHFKADDADFILLPLNLKSGAAEIPCLHDAVRQGTLSHSPNYFRIGAWL